MGVEQQYPEIDEYLDKSDTYVNTGSEFKQGNDRYLLVTQKGSDGQQLLFKWNGKKFDFWDNETIINGRTSVSGLAIPMDAHLDATVTHCGPSSSDDHLKVFNTMLAQANVFDSSSGPDHGNLACCWTVRHIVFNALKRWITMTDGTAEFGVELHTCFQAGSNEDQVPPGGIIISPTKNIPHSSARNIGHVGLLGQGSGDDRLIYSNSSSDAKFEQNYTVGRWKARYAEQKHLDVLFYSLPIKSLAVTS